MSEITAAFSIAFVIFIPFVLIDLIMANILLIIRKLAINGASLN